MITITTQTKDGLTTQHIIYDKHENPPPSKKVWKTYEIRYAMRGEYVEDINGRKVPVLYRNTLKRRRNRQHPINDIMLIFPGQTWIESKHNSRPFCWSTSPQTGVKSRRSTTQKAIARLILAGIKPEQAIRQATHRKTELTNKQVNDYIRSEKFLDALMEEAGIDKTNLKEELLKRGITFEAVAEQLVEWFQTKEIAWPLRKMAAEKIIETLEKKTRTQQPILQPLTGQNITNIEQINVMVRKEIESRQQGHAGQIVSQRSIDENNSLSELFLGTDGTNALDKSGPLSEEDSLA